MRRLLVPLVVLSLRAAAQPGWHGMDFSFILEHHGQVVPPEDLQRGKPFMFTVQGQVQWPHRVSTTDRSILGFPEPESDRLMHRDTLWLRIHHRSEGNMDIFFPPRMGDGWFRDYATHDRVVVFRPGKVDVQDLPREVQVKGHARGLGMPWQMRPSYSLNAWCGCDTVQDVAGPMHGTLEFRIRCRTLQRNDREEIELVLGTGPQPYGPELAMVVRTDAGTDVLQLDTFTFKPTRFLKSADQLLIPDHELPREEVYGTDEFGTWLRFFPVDPTPRDTLRITFEWLGGGERITASHKLLPSLEGFTELVVTLHRAPIDPDPRPQYRKRAVACVVPPLPPSLYVLSVVYDDAPNAPAPRFGPPEGISFQVAERTTR